jgi:hypothetical protein
MFSTKSKQSALAYKQDPDQQERHDGGDDDEDELSMLELFIRIVMFPIVVPVFMVYIYFFARGTPVAAELDALDTEDLYSDTSSNAEILTAFEKSKVLVRRVYKFLCCRPDSVSEVAKSNVLSYDAFMEQQKAAKKEPKMKTYDNLPPYVVDTNVSRTDRLHVEKDGVFVRNLFVPLSDVATLEKLLLEIETSALEEEEHKGIEFDEWDQHQSVKGDTQAVIKGLLEQAKQKQGVYTIEKSQTEPTDLKKNAILKNGKQSSADRGSSSVSIAPGSPEGGLNSGASTIPGTPGSSSKRKPKKAPHAEGTPLRERINMDVVLDRGAPTVDGPSIEAVPTDILKAMQ